MKRQTRTFIMREKTATFVALIDAYNTTKELLYDSADIGNAATNKITNLQIRLKRRIFKHMPSNIEEADIKRDFINNTLNEFKEKPRDIDLNESIAILQSLNRMANFYRSYYNHAMKHIINMDKKELTSKITD